MGSDRDVFWFGTRERDEGTVRLRGGSADGAEERRGLAGARCQTWSWRPTQLYREVASDAGVEIKGKGKGKSKTRGASGVEAKALTHGKVSSSAGVPSPSLLNGTDFAASSRLKFLGLPCPVGTVRQQIPGGMRLVDNAGQGNCLFLAISEALVAQGRSRRSASELRNLCCTHLRKHEATYCGFWRGDSPDATQSDISSLGFGEYLKLIGRDLSGVGWQPGACCLSLYV